MKITEDLYIDNGLIRESFVQSSGPGGQNVNKVATAVQLRFDMNNCSSLSPDVRQRLNKLAGSRLTEDGVIIIDARRFRTREQNRKDAYNRLAVLIRKATEKPRKRIRTQPSKGSVERRLESKKKNSHKKQLRNKQLSELKDEL